MKDKNSPPFRRSRGKIFFYAVLHVLCRWIGVGLFELRSLGRENFPAEGGGLVCSTHQSMMDPVLVGLVCNRRLNYLARKTLFTNYLFRSLIQALDAIEIDRDRGGLMGLRETMARLKRGELVLIFPEGTRTMDGKIGGLKPGFIAVARRSEVPLIPVSITGAYDVLPRGRKIPKRFPIGVTIGPSISPDEIAKLSDEELLEKLRLRLEECDRRGRAALPLRCACG